MPLEFFIIPCSKSGPDGLVRYPISDRQKSAEVLVNLVPRLLVGMRVMQTQLWRPNVGMAELGEDNLLHLGKNGLESITVEPTTGPDVPTRRAL
jgi:hypothetical protein